MIGAVLVATAFLAPVDPLTKTMLASTGFSLMFGSVVEWLTPVNKRDDKDASRAQSWGVSGPVNTVEQGLPVPIIYGEVLTGGYTISGGISVSQLVAGDTDANVTIGGRFDGVGSSDSQVVLMVSAGVRNIDPNYTYTWAVSGFAGRTVSLSGQGTATLRITVTGPSLGPNNQETSNGSVSCTVVGVSPNSIPGEPSPASGTGTQALVIYWTNLFAQPELG